MPGFAHQDILSSYFIFNFCVPIISYWWQQTIPNLTGLNTIQLCFLLIWSPAWIFLYDTVRCQHSQHAAPNVFCLFAFPVLCFKVAIIFMNRMWTGQMKNQFPIQDTGKYHFYKTICSSRISSVQFSCSIVSNSLWPHESQHASPLCPSPTPGVYPNSCPSSRWCHPAISSFVVPFSSCPRSFPTSGSFPMSQLFQNSLSKNYWNSDIC